MDYSDKDTKKRRELLPSLTDWINEPLTTAIDFFGRPIETFGRPFRQWWESVSPNVDVNESDKEIVVRAEVPGISDKDISLSYSQGILTIEGEKKSEAEYTKGQSKIRESKYGSFRRDIPLGLDLQWESAKATCKNGVLKVTIPKTATSTQSKKIIIE